MANKINVKLILELRKANMSRNEIAATRHISKNSVSEVIHLSDELGITYDDVADMDADTVYRMFFRINMRQNYCIQIRIMSMFIKNLLV